MEKKKEPIEKLEKEFRNFQKEWKKFRDNDFHHLVVNVDTLTTGVGTLIKQNDGMQQDMVTMDKNILTVQNCLRAIDENIITLMKREPR